MVLNVIQSDKINHLLVRTVRVIMAGEITGIKTASEKRTGSTEYNTNLWVKTIVLSRLVPKEGMMVFSAALAVLKQLLLIPSEVQLVVTGVLFHLHVSVRFCFLVQMMNTRKNNGQ
uniref:Uncharacterized protein n=2 Tax=Cacopsylla melanoneura TaxID=428564 RepID=A0A8D9E0U4_9HEMI